MSKALSRTAATPPWDDPVDERDPMRQQPTRWLQSIRDHWLLVVAIVGVALLAAVLYLSSAQKRYSAHAQIVVTPLPVDNTTFLGIGGLIRDSTEAQPVVTAAQLLNAPQVRERASHNLPGNVHATFGVTPLGQSNVIDIQATSSTPQHAQTAANVYAETALGLRKAALQSELAAAISRLQSRLAVAGKGGANAALNGQITAQLAQLNSLVGSPDPTLALLNRAGEPSSYSWPRPKLSLLVALLCGLVVGAIVAVLLDYFDPAAKTPRDLIGPRGPRMVVAVPEVPKRDLPSYARGTLADESEFRDGFRQLRGALMGPRATTSSPSVVAVCSNDRDEGRMMTAVGLAKSLADVGLRVILVDADTRLARASSALLESWPRATFSDALRNPSVLPEAVVPLATNLWFLPAGVDADGPDLVASGRLDDVLDTLREGFDSVVIDAPPFDDGPDGYAFAEAAGTVLVCVRLGHTNREGLHESLRRLEDLGVPPTGIVTVGPTAAGDFRGGSWLRGERPPVPLVGLEERVRAFVATRRGQPGPQSPKYD